VLNLRKHRDKREWGEKGERERERASERKKKKDKIDRGKE